MMKEGVRDRQSVGRVGELGVIDPSINSVFSRSDVPFLHVICDHASTDVSKAGERLFFCANYGQVSKEQATKYVRPSTISIMIMNCDISDGDFNESVAPIFAKAGNARY